MPSPRVMTSHLPSRNLPKDHIAKGGKIVHIIRNPKDVVLSAFHHYNQDPHVTEVHGVSKDLSTFLDSFLKGGTVTYCKAWRRHSKSCDFIWNSFHLWVIPVLNDCKAQLTYKEMLSRELNNFHFYLSLYFCWYIMPPFLKIIQTMKPVDNAKSVLENQWINYIFTALSWLNIKEYEFVRSYFHSIMKQILFIL